MTRSYLEVWLVEVRAHTTVVGGNLDLRVRHLSPHLLVIDCLDDFIEARQSDLEILVTRVVIVMILRGRLVSQLVLHDSEHFAHGEENAPCELVLIIDGEPPTEGIARTRSKYLRHREPSELLLLQNVVIILGLRSFTEMLAVSSCSLHLAHNLPSVVGVPNLHIKVGR